MRSALIAATLIISAPLYASEEGVLPLDVLHLESQGIGESGPVVVDGTQTVSGMQSLRVNAFGKQFELGAPQLKLLGGGMYNFVRISYERGYDELGGRTIYIQLGQSFTTGEVHSKYVIVTEDGNVQVKEKL